MIPPPDDLVSWLAWFIVGVAVFLALFEPPGGSHD